MQKNNTTLARTLVRRAAYLAPGHPVAHSFLALLEKQKTVPHNDASDHV